jgi:hypothetical protein
MNDVDRRAWLADVLARLPDHPPTKSPICSASRRSPTKMEIEDDVIWSMASEKIASRRSPTSESKT